MLKNEEKMNQVYLYGTVTGEPIFTHKLFDESFYEFTLSVMRLSGQTDNLPISVSEKLLEEAEIKPGAKIAVAGQFRSFNKPENNRSRLLLTVFARAFPEVKETPINPNRVELVGFICKPPVYRTTPFNREITDMLLAVNRAYAKSDYIPCIAWGNNARRLSKMGVGTKVAVSGRIQSRVYIKRYEDGTSEERTAYEMSVSAFEVVDTSNSEVAATDE